MRREKEREKWYRFIAKNLCARRYEHALHSTIFSRFTLQNISENLADSSYFIPRISTERVVAGTANVIWRSLKALGLLNFASWHKQVNIYAFASHLLHPHAVLCNCDIMEDCFPSCSRSQSTLHLDLNSRRWRGYDHLVNIPEEDSIFINYKIFTRHSFSCSYAVKNFGG